MSTVPFVQEAPYAALHPRAAGTPAYLVVDPGRRVLAAFTQPVEGAYTARADDGTGTVELSM